jgi:hypothetical protein
MLDIPEAFLTERRKLGLDKRDEMWEGELHVVPPSNEEHQRVEGELFLVLAPLAKAARLLIRAETGLFDPAVEDFTSYRFALPVSMRAADGIVQVRVGDTVTEV